MTYMYEGNEYHLIRDWEPDEKLAYRELEHGHIEVLEMFLNEVKLTKVHAGFMRIVLDARAAEENRQREMYWKKMQELKTLKEAAI